MNTADRKTALHHIYKGFEFEGKQIVDETCYCKHLRSEHLDRFAIGHGACTVHGCQCNQFTWRNWLVE